MKTKAFIVSFLLVLLAVPVMSYAATVTVSQSGADTGTVMKGRTFNIQVSGLSGSGSVNLIDLPSGFSTEEGTSKSFSEGTASVTWTTAEISQTQSDVKIKASIQITGSPSTAESSSFDVVLPPSISLSVTPTSYSNIAAGSGKVFNLDIPNTGGTSAKSVALTVLGGGASIQSGCDTISSVSAGGSSSLTCTVSFTSSATATFTATPSNADSKSDTVTITVHQPASGETPSSPGTSPGGAPGLPPAEEDENVTTEKQKKDKPKEEKVTASNRPDIVPGVGLRNNTKLQAAIEKVLAKGKMSENARQNMLRLSAAITAEIATERNFEATNESSKITTKMKYNGKKKAKNFIVYEKIPKSFAESADEITVNTNGRVEIVENDPEYAIVFSELNPGQSIDISYTVNKKVDASVIDAMATEVYAESIEDTPIPAGEPPVIIPEDKGISPVLVFIIILVLVAVAGYIIVKKRQKKQEPSRPGPVQQPEEEKPETSSEEIDEVKDKITD